MTWQTTTQTLFPWILWEHVAFDVSRCFLRVARTTKAAAVGSSCTRTALSPPEIGGTGKKKVFRAAQELLSRATCGPLRTPSITKLFHQQCICVSLSRSKASQWHSGCTSVEEVIRSWSVVATRVVVDIRGRPCGFVCCPFGLSSAKDFLLTASLWREVIFGSRVWVGGEERCSVDGYRLSGPGPGCKGGGEDITRYEKNPRWLQLWRDYDAEVSSTWAVDPHTDICTWEERPHVCQ